MNHARHPARVHLDSSRFEPMTIQAVEHTLVAHPLLQLAPLVELGQRLGAKGSVRFHDDQASAGTDFVKAVDLHPVPRQAPEIIEDIAHAKAWLALHHVQQDPDYCALVDELLDSVQPIVEARDPHMHHRAGWIFVTSPGAITPFHMDHEHNFILQVAGRKRVHVFDPLDREILSERALERFHHWGSRELVQWTEAIQRRAQTFELTPGMGAYMPVTAPHWVENGPEPSVTISCTYYSRETRRRKRLHQVNCALRDRGLDPAPVGAHPLVDRAKDRLYAGVQRARTLAARVRRRPFNDLDVAHAIPHTEIYG